MVRAGRGSYTSRRLPPPNPFTPQIKYANAPVPKLRDNPAIEEADKSDKPPFVQKASNTYETGAHKHQAQERTLLSVDDMVGAVFAALHATGQGRDTLAFFLSDNGLLWGEHGLVGKQVPYLQSIKVPMMMRWPAAGIRATIDRRLVANDGWSRTSTSLQRSSKQPTIRDR